MKRVLFFAYGLTCYLMFGAVYLYAIGFVGNIAVPRSIDSAVGTPWPAALMINLGLLAVFGLQHTIMARPTFKRLWTRIVPEPIERSTYVLFSNLAMILLFWQWRAIDAVVWDVQSGPARNALWALFAGGWLIIVVATLMLNHFDLFGLRQVWLHLRGRPYTRLTFAQPVFYRHVRHPLYVGWLTAFWVTPTMTAGHLLFAIGATAYILIAIQFEERNLLEAHGADYAEYRRRVPMLIPMPRRVSRAAATEAQRATA
ncbi:MAG: isoprenylcysteine carboxylmethyltransferase family protein [Phycisphaerae bacterium]|nr:isoprenylcysteine carboxylmethyltransferase family protein [Phycisphaerae bacterium]NUQ46070.1 isoprenylcysteine carboxylmethyltransferase family protein [Phycisphaerae bacterium]